MSKDQKTKFKKIGAYTISILVWLFLHIKFEGGGVSLLDLRYTFLSILIAISPSSIGELIFVYGSLAILLYVLRRVLK
jgi:hypothetical protein